MSKYFLISRIDSKRDIFEIMLHLSCCINCADATCDDPLWCGITPAVMTRRSPEKMVFPGERRLRSRPRLPAMPDTPSGDKLNALCSVCRDSPEIRSR